MAIRINTNLFSLFINRNLQRSSDRLEDAYQKLASGERINRAADDPAGLAKSHALRAKIAGLQRNLLNTNEGLSITSVAESSLSNITDILQRLRELAVQASNSTMGDRERMLLQEEVNKQLEEIERVGSTANYNDKKLLDGTFADLRLQVGTRMDESIPFSIADARASVLGVVARGTGALGVSPAGIAGTGDLTINGVVVPASQGDLTSIISPSASAIAKAKAINAVAHLTGVTAKAGPAMLSDSGAAILGGSLDGSASALFINGINIGPVDFLPGDGSGMLCERINACADMTGVTASRGLNNELVLTAADGRNFEVQTTGNCADELGLRVGNGDIAQTVSGTIMLTSNSTIQIGGAIGLIGFTAGQGTIFADPSTAIKNLKIITFDDAQNALTTLDTALQQVLKQRADLGALEGRLNKTIDDLMVNIENLTGADSRIRDADFAVETARLTQAQIIQQAGISILAQANMIPQMALNLLQK